MPLRSLVTRVTYHQILFPAWKHLFVLSMGKPKLSSVSDARLVLFRQDNSPKIEERPLTKLSKATRTYFHLAGQFLLKRSSAKTMWLQFGKMLTIVLQTCACNPSENVWKLDKGRYQISWFQGLRTHVLIQSCFNLLGLISTIHTCYFRRYGNYKVRVGVGDFPD